MLKALWHILWPSENCKLSIQRVTQTAGSQEVCTAETMVSRHASEADLQAVVLKFSTVLRAQLLFNNEVVRQADQIAKEKSRERLTQLEEERRKRKEAGLTAHKLRSVGARPVTPEGEPPAA